MVFALKVFWMSSIPERAVCVDAIHEMPALTLL
jgi:hypothetical protein